MDHRKEFRVEPDAKVKLNKLDPAYTGKHEFCRTRRRQEIEAYQQKLFQQQALLFAQHEHKVLVVLQALDTAGKDGTIKHVFAGLIRRACAWSISSSQPRRSWLTIFYGASTRRRGRGRW